MFTLWKVCSEFWCRVLEIMRARRGIALDFPQKPRSRMPEHLESGGGSSRGVALVTPNAALEHFSLSYIPLKQSRNHAWAFSGEISGRALAIA